MANEGSAEPPTDRVPAAVVTACGLLTGASYHFGVVPPEFVAGAATLTLTVAAVVRLVALALAPRTADSRFVYDLEHASAMSFQFLASAAMFTIFVVLPSLGRTPSHGWLVVKSIGLAVLAVTWMLLTVRIRRHSRDRGGLVAAFGLTDDVAEVTGILFGGRTGPERVVRVLLRSIVVSILLAGLSTAVQAHEQIARRDSRQGPREQRHDDGGAVASPSPPRSNPSADEKCGYNVSAEIADGVPAPVAAALARVLINPDGDEDVEAPGVDAAGCPDEGTHASGKLFVTPLFHWDSGAPMGLLVSDDAANAAVVFSELRAHVERLIDQGRLVRVTRRVGTARGDLQLLFVDGHGCVVAIRQYNQPYHVLAAGSLDHLMRLVDARQEVPRLLPPIPKRRAAFQFEFARTRPRIVTVERQDSIATTSPPTDVAVSRGCPNPVGFLETAYEQEPEPQSTP